MGTICLFLVATTHWTVFLFILQIPESHPFQMEICFSFHQQQTLLELKETKEALRKLLFG